MQHYLEELRKRIDSYHHRSELTARNTAIKLIFWNIKYLFKHTIRKSKFSDNVFHIAFVPLGGIGDFAYAAKYIYCLKKYFREDITVNILSDYHLETSACLWKQPNIDHLHPYTESSHYDCEIALCRFPFIRYIDKKRFQKVASEKLKHYLETVSHFMKKHQLLYQSDYLGRCFSLLHGRVRENQADIENILDMSKINDFTIPLPTSDYEKTLQKFSLREDQYIVFQTGSGHHFKDSNDVRLWPLEHYEESIRKIKKINPSIQVIQIGEEYHESVKHTDINLLGKTSFNEMLAILKGARLLLSQEGGMSILRHFISRKCSCVIFGPTDKEFYGFSENINLTANLCNGCEWLTDDWNLKCTRGYSIPLCMKSISPEMVVHSIKKYLT